MINTPQHRDHTVFDGFADGSETGGEYVLYPLVRLGDWPDKVANTSCAFMTARDEHTENPAKAEVKKTHQAPRADEFARSLKRTALELDSGVTPKRLNGARVTLAREASRD
ncbi:MAG: hypothetical protein AB3N13_11905 [Arenibacterium sp.]